MQFSMLTSTRKVQMMRNVFLLMGVLTRRSTKHLVTKTQQWRKILLKIIKT